MNWLLQKGESWEFFDDEQDPDGVFAKALKSMGYDGAVLVDTDGEVDFDSYAVLDPSQIKSADPITRDNNGKVIPLSENLDRVFYLPKYLIQNLQ